MVKGGTLVNEERLFILKMLEEGKINAQEAAALLEALEIGSAGEAEERAEVRGEEPVSRPADDGGERGAEPHAGDGGSGAGDEASHRFEADPDREREEARGEEERRREEERSREEHERGWGAFSWELAQQIRESIQSAMRGVPQITEELKENLQDVREEISHSLKEVREEIKKGPLVDVSGLKHLFANVFGRGPGHQFEEQVKGVWPKGTQPKIECATKNGGITVQGWEEPYYRVTVRKWVDWHDEDEAERVAAEAVKIVTEEDGLRVICREGDRVGATIDLMLPKDYVYTLSATSTNGAVSLQEIRVTEGRASTTNGAVRVKKVKGERIGVGTTNGRISCDDVQVKTIEAQTTNGGITWDGSAEEARLRTTNGGIRLAPALPREATSGAANGRPGAGLSEAPDSEAVGAVTGAGPQTAGAAATAAAGGAGWDESTGAGAQPITGRYWAETTNAGIHVKLPADPELGVRFEAKGRGIDLGGEKHRFEISGELKHGPTQFVTGSTRAYENARRRMSFQLKTTNGSIRFETDRSHRDGGRDGDDVKGDA